MMGNNLWGTNATQFFFELNPDLVLDTVEKLGFRTTGRVLTMNSMENRVYEVEIESDSKNPSDHSKIIKFYRPGRWTFDQIQEEHDFLLDLTEFEVPVVAPLEFEGKTLFTLAEPELFYTVFPKQGGRAPDEFTNDEIEQVGRLLARLHNVGSMKKATHRLKLSTEVYLKSNLDFLVGQKIVPSHLELSFKTLLEDIYNQTKNAFNNVTFGRIHGDCHLGNILKREETFHLIDFDDMVIGPAVQDMWLLLPGRDEYAENLRFKLLEGYTTMRDFNYEELKLTEVLRTLRMINYSAWIAKRYEDPAFKNAFPFFESPNYWEGQLNDLRGQLAILQNEN
jgi:Ser/Thr protein kinase RdoA (MazF antagonist)